MDMALLNVDHYFWFESVSTELRQWVLMSDETQQQVMDWTPQDYSLVYCTYTGIQGSGLQTHSLVLVVTDYHGKG